MDNVLQNVASTVVSEGVTLVVDIRRKWWEKLLRRPSQRVFHIHPITLGSLVQISKRLLSIDTNISDMKNLLEMNYHLMEDHTRTAAEVVAIAIHNKPGEPPAALVRFIINTFTAKEVFSTLSIVIKQMDVTSFMSSIILVKGGMNVIEMSPKDQGSLIASGA
jgi:hypothetical protein